MTITVNVHHFFGSGTDNTILALLKHVHEVVDRIDENVLKLLEAGKPVGIEIKPGSPVPRSPDSKEYANG